MKPSAPLTEAVIVAVAQLVDDAQSDRRDPSHSELQFLFRRAGLSVADPLASGQNVGKAKRVRTTLSWALEHNPEAGGQLTNSIVAVVRGHGGFRPSSPNYVGGETVENAIQAFASEGYELAPNGELRPMMLDNLSGVALTDALKAYIRRAKRGAEDAALVTGTGKDLLEAVCAYVLEQRYGSYSSTANFPTLLGQAFAALDMATPQHPVERGEPPQKRIERALYELACGINQLRNKQGTGHGRPWLPTVTQAESRMATESMGVIAERLLLLGMGTK